MLHGWICQKYLVGLSIDELPYFERAGLVVDFCRCPGVRCRRVSHPSDGYIPFAAAIVGRPASAVCFSVHRLGSGLTSSSPGKLAGLALEISALPSYGPAKEHGPRLY